jgi:hypothetical protein
MEAQDFVELDWPSDKQPNEDRVIEAAQDVFEYLVDHTNDGLEGSLVLLITYWMLFSMIKDNNAGQAPEFAKYVASQLEKIHNTLPPTTTHLH